MAVRYQKVKDDRLLKQLEGVLSIQSARNYIPIYERFFKLNKTNWDHVNLQVPWAVHEVLDASGSVVVQSPEGVVRSTRAFFKYSPLLDPNRYMSGGYEGETLDLPSFEGTCYAKLREANNSSYVDGFFSFLSSRLRDSNPTFVHGVEYYGTYLGVKTEFTYNLEDEYILETSFFKKNTPALFEVRADFGMRGYSRRLCPRLQVDGEMADVPFSVEEVPFEAEVEEVVAAINEVVIPTQIVEVADVLVQEVVCTDMQEVVCPDMQEVVCTDMQEVVCTDMQEVAIDVDVAAQTVKLGDGNESDWSDENNSEESDTSSDASDEEGEELSEEASEDYSEPIPVCIRNFPVQVIAMECCTDTMDSVLDSMKPDELASALFQIVFTLLVYQDAFDFTHNDLHTNNVMYVPTDEPYLYYAWKDRHYRVPTHGRIFKIIDFGRSIYTFQGTRFMSDSFAPQGDAATQYNCEPFFDASKPRLDPNYSFDLCRLACSMVDMVPDKEEFAELNALIEDWCMDDKGRHVVFKKNGEERYPNFKLYKMIARTVHNHTPHAQFARPLFRKYEVAKRELKGKRILNANHISKI